MHFDATDFLILGSVAAFAIWVWRFASVLQKTPRDMRAAALRGSAKAMGSEFWEQGNPYQHELEEELSIQPYSIMHALRWPNSRAEIFSFQEVGRLSRGRSYTLDWVGYRFGDRLFPKFDLKPTRTASLLRRGWWRRVSLPGQIEFESRYTLTGENRGMLEQFFSPERCAVILSREWPRGISLKAGGHWLLVHRETFLQASGESDSEESVAKEIQEVSSLVVGSLPLAEALTDLQLAGESRRYVGQSQDTAKKARPWWDRLELLLVGVVIALAILASVAFLGKWWAQFDDVILKTEARRYLFAALFIAVFFAIGEWMVRSYHRTKVRAAARLEARYSVLPNES